MVHLDGSQHSGSGTLVRFAAALAALTGRPISMTNVRAAREKPGLRPQHVTAVRACSELCGGAVAGARVGAHEFTLTPGTSVRGGRYVWDIGSAGSATMLALAVLPVACFADGEVNVQIQGGLFQDFAPSPYHLQHVLLPLLERTGVEAECRILRPGYVPAGGGVLALRVQPLRAPLRSFRMTEAGSAIDVRGIALASHLSERRVSERMAQACELQLRGAGLHGQIERAVDTQALQPGAGLAVWARTSAGCLFGADRAGAPRRSAEAIGRFVARQLLADLRSGATVDRHAADQLVLFAGLAAGATIYTVPAVTEHVRSNLWLVERFGARTRCDGLRVEIDGLALCRRHTGRDDRGVRRMDR